ncbi:MAG: hypothetical protein LKF33_06265 [Prevotella sp.]|jgi:hypothetical protein|nr:hypothetical protein [Prevotella sp.]
MKTREYIKPNIEHLQIPELMQTILPGGSTPPGEGDAKPIVPVEDDEWDEEADQPAMPIYNVWDE